MSKETGVPGWLVVCPRRGRMAAMRCGEYQRRDSCAPGCGSAAQEHTLVALSTMRDSLILQHENLSSRLNQPKYYAPSSHSDDDWDL